MKNSQSMRASRNSDLCLQDFDAERATELTFAEAQAANRIGDEYAMVCRTCGKVTWLDKKDAQQCSSCNSADVVGVDDLVGQACPMCKTGVNSASRAKRCILRL